MRSLSRCWLIAMIAVALVFIVSGALQMFQSRPDTLGVTGGHLAGCPGSPNCVSTEAERTDHRIEPLTFSGSAEQAVTRLLKVLEGMPRTRLITRKNDYLHFECRSRLLGFIDDLEFFVDPHQHQIQIRSASRVGYSDLGVNRKRVHRLRRAFEQQLFSHVLMN
jgi:uncharacterized protein (DUF1499 family)